MSKYSEKGSKNHICNVCGRVFAFKHSFKEHMDTHSGNFKYQCNECEFASSNLGTFKKHQDCHLRDKGTFGTKLKILARLRETIIRVTN